MNEFEAYLEAKAELTTAKRKEMRLRRDLFTKYHGTKDVEASRQTQTVDGYVIKTATTVVLAVMDAAALVDLVEEIEAGMLTPEEMDAFTIVPKTSLAKMLKLPDDASVWQYYYIKPSDTPTISVVRCE